MTVSVLVPWRSTPDRAPLWDFLRPRWEALGYEVVEGSCPPDEPWVKALAVGDALSRASGDVLVIADADVWTDGVEDAIAHVCGGWPWAVPHHLVYRLTPDGTRAVIDFGQWPFPAPCERAPYRGFAGGGVTVVRRDAYELAPLDPRFAGWGQEDESWALALRVLCGRPWRGSAPLWHLWHEPAPRLDRFWGSDESMALALRYREARSYDAMCRLVAEIR